MLQEHDRERVYRVWNVCPGGGDYWLSGAVEE